DTNSLYIAKKLGEKGILMDMKMVVGDNRDNLSWTIKNACKRSQLVIVSGGLGPTEDDITRESASDALKLKLIFDDDIIVDIEEMFRVRGIDMPQINKRQAFVLEGAEVLSNSAGTAPGQYFDNGKVRLLLLPGPPKEMIPIFDKILEEKISPLSNFHIYKRILKFGGITESEADSMISGIYRRYKNPITTILASPGLIEVHLLGRAKKDIEEIKELTDQVAEDIREKMCEYLITEEDVRIEELIIREMTLRGLSLSVAESCTGGGLGNILTNVPGSSKVFLGGVIPYSNELKTGILDVKEETLEKHGAVSKHAAKEMAENVRKLTGSDIGVSITGIAGPGGGTSKKPVGLVFMHMSTPEKEIGEYRIFPGDREVVKIRTINYCLNMIFKYLKHDKV
ncbi:MAG: competence/damage-inducible protein A, partial [Candidatus Aminicenantes bacterium]|nr:competence/damage-inducible protein A [Candidatus Aminicenantes bacterium]